MFAHFWVDSPFFDAKINTKQVCLKMEYTKKFLHLKNEVLKFPLIVSTKLKRWFFTLWQSRLAGKSPI